MYLGHLKSLLASGQVSQYIPQGVGTSLASSTGGGSGFSTLTIPSRDRQFRLGRGNVYIFAIWAVSGTYPSLTWVNENHKFDCVSLGISNLTANLFTNYSQKWYYSNSGTAGYQGGGSDGNTAQTQIQKFTYSNETASTLGATSSGSGRIANCVNNNQVAAYITGSLLGTLGTAIDKHLYSNDTRSTLSATVSQARYGDSGFTNSGTAGYRCFGEG